MQTATIAELGPSQLDIEVIDHADRLGPPLLRQVYQYWDSKRVGQRYPARADLDPVDLPLLLPHLILIDVRRDPFDLVVRLAGTQVVRSIGSEITGRRLGELPMSDSAALFEAYAQVVSDGRPRRISGTCFIPPDRWPQVDHVVMPLARDGEQPDMLFGGMMVRCVATPFDNPPRWARSDDRPGT